jgi:hypothetical protein
LLPAADDIPAISGRNIQQLQQQIEILLESNPQLQEYQEEIENYLEKAGTLENRLAVIEFLMAQKVTELQSFLLDLFQTLEKVNHSTRIKENSP